MIIKYVKRFKLVIVSLILYLIVFIVNREIFFSALETLKMFLLEMAEILPAIIIITGLLSVYVPPAMIMKNFGDKSGIKGKIISFVIGAVSAGPIYAAFPVSLMLLKKGASVSNIVIILSSWATVKLPMLLFEIKFLGLQFSLTRYVLTVAAILGMSYAMDKVVKKEQIDYSAADVDLVSDETSQEEISEILGKLPGLNCRRCGYQSCRDFAIAIYKDKEKVENCLIS